MEGRRETTIVRGQAMALRVSFVHLVVDASLGQHGTLWHNPQLQGFKCDPHKTRKASDAWASRGRFPARRRSCRGRAFLLAEAGRGGRGCSRGSPRDGSLCAPAAPGHRNPAQAELAPTLGSHL